MRRSPTDKNALSFGSVFAQGKARIYEPRVTSKMGLRIGNKV